MTPAALPPLTADDVRSVEPTITSLPIVCDEDGEFLGWGHIVPLEFATAVNALDAHWGSGDEPWRPDQVRHVWVTTAISPHDGGEWWVVPADEDAPGAFAVTRLP